MKTNLSAIIDTLDTVDVAGNTDAIVADLTSDSKAVVENSLFACIKGGRVDGHSFADDAIKRGASVLLCERRLETAKPVTQVIVDDVRRALANVSSRFFGDPSKHLTVIGVTGTNGKTTTVHYLRSILEAWGQPVGIMGTLGHWIGRSVTKDSFTTPGSPEVHRYMRLMLDRGIRFCVMEVSSHAIAQSRVDYVNFDVVAFTNLTRDHLDFHDGFEDYTATKMRLMGIDDEGDHFGDRRQAVVNTGDDVGRQIASRSPLSCLTYRLGGDADVRCDIVEVGWEGSKLRVKHEGATVEVETALIGRANAENALAAFAVSSALDIDEDAISTGIAAIKSVPGRMEVIAGPGRWAIVDYAHTPDALERLLEDVTQMCTGRIICVFGCGGDRDQGKRPEMGEIAGRIADLTIVTSDNPRSEDPLKIIDQIVKGVPDKANYEVVPDRGEAIQRAVTLSKEGDIVVIAGKGHEDHQIVGTTRIDFDDRQAVRKAFGAVTSAKP
ncbi:MAG: UDP-N-acetylmuramoyl-L-alanyl-D-glutamate--2,6-diaminopimelate ligase [Candidatus Eisenbacteria bacterium]